MLGLTTAVFPDQRLIYAALIIRMRVEFPHLTALKHLLLREKSRPTILIPPIESPASEPGFNRLTVHGK